MQLRILRQLRIEADPIILVCYLHNFVSKHENSDWSKVTFFFAGSLKIPKLVSFRNLFEQFQNTKFPNLDENNAFCCE